jgi:hypothetical protein
MYSYTRPNIYKALVAFIKELLPNLEVRQGNQNRAALPKINEYALIWVHHSTRRGTNERQMSSVTDEFTESASRKVFIEVDFIGENALIQAEMFETAFACIDAPEILGKHGVFPHYVEAIDDATFVNDQEQFIPCYRVYAYVGITGKLKRETETFSGIITKPVLIT